jgi:hypothetical protein
MAALITEHGQIRLCRAVADEELKMTVEAPSRAAASSSHADPAG